MVAIGFVVMYLSVAGLPALAPILARITLCENMDPHFLIGKVLQDSWNWSIQIQDGQEHWEAGGDTIATLTTVEANSYNSGIAEQDKASNRLQREGRLVINPFRRVGTSYPASEHDPLIQQAGIPVTMLPPSPRRVRQAVPPLPFRPNGTGTAESLPRLSSSLRTRTPPASAESPFVLLTIMSTCSLSARQVLRGYVTL